MPDPRSNGGDPLNIIIAGQDRLAVALADSLSAAGDNVRIVEGDEAHLESIPSSITNRPNVALDEAELSRGDLSTIDGIADCQLLVAATRSDAVNNLIALQASEVHEIKQVYAVIVDDKLAEVYDSVGSDGAIIAINPDAKVLADVAGMIAGLKPQAKDEATETQAAADSDGASGGDKSSDNGTPSSASRARGESQAASNQNGKSQRAAASAAQQNGIGANGHEDDRSTQKYIIIVGAGAIGTRFASAQISAGNEVTVIDISAIKVQKAQAALGSVLVLGDATRSETLVNAGIERADAVFAVSGDDATNLAVCQLASSSFKVRNVAAIANYGHNAVVFRKTGADIVNRTELSLANLTGTLLRYPMADHGTINDRNDKLVTMRIPRDAPSVGRRFGDLAQSLPYGLIIAVVVSPTGDPFVPSESTVLEGGEHVISTCPEDRLSEYAYALTGREWITIAA